VFVCQSNGGASDPSVKSENIDVETVIAHNINFQKNDQADAMHADHII
jgi:hypothetical protein